ncbi:Gfo/Idh/MocA family protein [Paenibacillus sp. GCM10027626]|uniref:Gfo/Idh/MocA family protein n=1 Tax=Paenibacillus sp. GCM10027626 TaxID=3273411 RepID=UPI00363114EB
MNNPILIGLAGLGRAGLGMHAAELKGKEAQFKFVAAGDPLKSCRDKMEQEYGCRTYERFEELIADPEVELVDIATRSSDHFAQGIMALEAGKHVLIEKPLCLTYDEALRLREASGKFGGELFVRHNRRFDPDFLHVKEIIASGLLGDVFEIKLYRHSFQWRDDWQTMIAYGGGQLLNWGPHIIDHALQLLDSPIQSLWSDLQRLASAGDAEDHIKIVLKGRNGRIVDVEISGSVALPSPSYAVYGSNGALTVQGDSIQMKVLDPASDNRQWQERTIPIRPTQQYDFWDELYASIRYGAVFPIKIDEAVEVMRVITEAKKGTVFA